VGKAADAIGKLAVFMVGSTLTIIMVLIYTHLGVTSLAVVIAINVVLFIGIFSRMIPFQALMSAVPTATQRGSFSAINASVQQLSGGLAAVIAGHIVTVGADGKLQHYDVAGYVVVGTTLITVALLWYLHRKMGAHAERPQVGRATA
jgi:predicted MFS family arabinose efflux permease